MKSFKGLVKIAQERFLKNSPQILTGIGVAGVFATAILAVRATPKAVKILEEAQAITADKLSKTDAIRLCWKEYIPATIMGVVTSACIICSCRIHTRREVALLSLYSLTESALREYQNKVREMIGSGKESKVRDSIASDRIKQNPLAINDVIITGSGNVLCYDSPSGRYFRSDIEKIKRKENELNMRLRTEMVLTLNDLYYELGLQGTKLGEGLGWDIEKALLTLAYSSQLTENGEPCLVIDYDIYPLRQNYGV